MFHSLHSRWDVLAPDLFAKSPFDISGVVFFLYQTMTISSILFKKINVTQTLFSKFQLLASTSRRWPIPSASLPEHFSKISPGPPSPSCVMSMSVPQCSAWNANQRGSTTSRSTVKRTSDVLTTPNRQGECERDWMDYSSDLAAGVNCQSVFVSRPLQKNL